jgi:hypothetical protein
MPMALVVESAVRLAVPQITVLLVAAPTIMVGVTHHLKPAHRG